MELKFTKEQQSIYSRNKCLAWKYFYPKGNGKAKPGYVLHHIDDSWRHTNIERYIQWNIYDLQMMTNSEHSSLHLKGKPSKHKGIPFSAETREKMSAVHSNIGEETKQKMSATKKGMKFFNNGVINVRAKECPDGFIKWRI